MNEERRCSVLLALQVALLSAIPAHLRAVTVRWTDTDVHFDCYFDGAITDDDEETMTSSKPRRWQLFLPPTR